MNENVIFLIMLGIILCLVYLLYILPSMMTDYKVNGCYIQPTNVSTILQNGGLNE